MAARRCSVYGINLPPSYASGTWGGTVGGPQMVCPVDGCDEPLIYVTDSDPDPNWQEKLKRLNDSAARDAEVEQEIPTVEAQVRTRDGQLFILSWDIWPATRRRLKEHDLLRVGKQTFEVLGYVEPTREYWVRAFSMTLSDDDLRALSGH